MNDRVDEIFLEAREIPDPKERAAFLSKACENDPDLLAYIQRLLADEARAESFFGETESNREAETINLKFDTEPPGVAGEREGQWIGRYQLLQRLGEGGFGSVWMAEQTEPVKRRVAVKIIKPGMDSREIIARFEAERQALAMMDHPNIAKVLDAGATDTGRPYFVMELVRGRPVTQFCDEWKLDTKKRLFLFGEICSAINHAHQKGIIHRDLKPSNVLVTLHGDRPVPVVIDFGIAKATMGKLTDKTLFTRYDQFIGTPAYMSPEQVGLSALDVDTRSDIYSLGVLLYELLAGFPPFDPKTLIAAGFDEMRRIIREVDPPRPSLRVSTSAGEESERIQNQLGAHPQKLGRLLKGDLDWIVMKALEKDRSRRYETADALAEDIKRYLTNGLVLARPPSKFYEFQKTVRRHKFGFAATTAIIVVLAIGVAMTSWQATQARQAEGKARRAQQAAEGEQMRAEKLSAQNLDQLVETLTANGTERIQNDEPALALSWLVKALQIDENNPARQRMQRVRIAQLLDQVPQLHRFWTKPGYATDVRFSADGNYAFAVGAFLGGHGRAGGGFAIWNVQTGDAVELNLPTETILHAAFAPHSARLATISQSGKIYLSDLGNNAPPIACQQTHPKGHHVVFSRDGTKLLSYGYNRLAKLWDAKTGKVLISRLEGNWGSNLRGGDFSQNGEQVAILDYSGRHFVFDVNTGQLAMPSGKRGGQNLGLQYSPDGKVFVTAGLDGQPVAVYVWDSVTGAEVTHFEHNRLTSFAISPDSKAVASSSADFKSAVQIWNIHSGKLIAQTPGIGPVSMVRFSADGQHIATAAWNNTAQIWNARTGKPIGPPLRHAAAVQSVDFHPTGRYLLTGCVDGTIRIWTLALMPVAALSIRPEGGADRIALDSSGQRLLTCNAGGLVQVWDSIRGQPVGAPILLGSPAEQADFVPGSDLILTVSRAPAVQLWDSRTGKPHGAPITPELAGESVPANAVQTMFAMNSQGEAIVAFSTSSKSSFRVWNTASGESVFPAVEGRSLQHFELSSDGQTLATIRAGQSSVEFWSAKSGAAIRPPLEFEDFYASGSFSPEGNVFALMTGTAPVLAQPDFSALQAWNVQNGKAVIPRSFRSGSPGVLCYDRLGQRMAVSYDNRLYVLDARNAQPATSPMTHQAKLVDACFSPDGHYLCSLDGSERLYLHDAATGQAITVPILHPGKILQALFTPDSTRIATACSDGLVRLWDLAPTQASVEDLALRTELLSGHRIDQTGALSPLSSKECETQWEAWNRQQSAGTDSTLGTPKGGRIN